MNENLLEDLRVLGRALPTSHVTTPQEGMEVLSALVQYVAHGDEIVKFARDGEMSPTMNVPMLETLLSPDSEPRAVAVTAPVTGSAANNATHSDIAALATQVAEMQRLMADQQSLMLQALQGARSGTVDSAAPAPADSPPPTPPPSGGGDGAAAIAAAAAADAAAIGASKPTAVTVEPIDAPQHPDRPPVIAPAIPIEPEPLPEPVIDPAPSDESTRK